MAGQGPAHIQIATRRRQRHVKTCKARAGDDATPGKETKPQARTMAGQALTGHAMTGHARTCGKARTGYVQKKARAGARARHARQCQ